MSNQRSRRDFLTLTASSALALGAAASLPSRAGATRPGVPGPRPDPVRPPRLRPGDTVGLVNPAGATWNPMDVDIVRETFEAMGLKVRVGDHVLDRHGYLAGLDQDRADDVNRMFADRDVRGVVCIRGGWGCARLLPLLDYEAVRRDPKVLLGYSDITALHTALHARTGLVTFHGPVGISRWSRFNVEWLRRVVFGAEAVTFENDKEFNPEQTLALRENRTRVLTPGVARGRLLGGNLTVLSTIVGSGYLPDFTGCVLFLEDVEEAPYRIDRMLTQLSLAGILGRAAAVVFGNCTGCTPGAGYGSLTLDDVLVEHLVPLGVPAWHGAQIGHIDEQFTLPVGAEVEVDAAAGTIRMLEPAVA
ncbi:MAG TPA: LD-carboxypeptidase [Longimicrobiales bacterium]|nr:LD-carboxypeptidase [Longimicrobiales bacterium]